MKKSKKKGERGQTTDQADHADAESAVSHAPIFNNPPTRYPMNRPHFERAVYVCGRDFFHISRECARTPHSRHNQSPLCQDSCRVVVAAYGVGVPPRRDLGADLSGQIARKVTQGSLFRSHGA